MLTRAIRQIQEAQAHLAQVELLGVVVVRGVMGDVIHQHEAVTQVAVVEPQVTAMSRVWVVQARSDLARSPLALAPQQQAIAAVVVVVDIVQVLTKEVLRVAVVLGF
jgi:hypothetical protein